jgi:hypothetical protein
MCQIPLFSKEEQKAVIVSATDTPDKPSLQNSHDGVGIAFPADMLDFRDRLYLPVSMVDIT